MVKLLVLNFFPAFAPASSGGELRVGKLYRALSDTHEITMLTSTNFDARFEEIVHTPNFRELRFPKDQLWRQAYATLEKAGVFGDLSGLAFALAVSDPACELRQKAWDFAEDADYIIHEFPFSEPIFAEGAPKREIYNSHNFEISLLSSIVYGPGFDTAFLKLERLERNLIKRAHRVFATSEADAKKFRLFYDAHPGRLSICPNGFDEAELRRIAEARRSASRKNDRPKLLFMGSAHHPNVEAALFLTEIAEEISYCDIILAGGVSNALTGRKLPSNIVLFGHFDAADKIRLLTEADLFVNPVTLGSGTSLKALEALGAHIPMVSTPEGSRGLQLVPGKHAMLVPRQKFSTAIGQLLADPQRSASIAAEGYALACKTFTWNRIAENFAATIDQPSSLPQSMTPLLLALNDYAVLHATSGGAARICNLLQNTPTDTVLVTFGSSCDFLLLAPNLLLITVPKTAEHMAYEAAVNEGQKMSVNDGVASLFVASNRVLVGIIAALARRAQVAVFEHPYMAPMLGKIRQIRPDIGVVYSSHNVEATHKAGILQEHTAGRTITALIKEVEDFLVKNSDIIVCCTEADAQYFTQSGKKIIVVPNGCALPETAQLLASRSLQKEGEKPRIGFLGSSHGPNVEAAMFILNTVAPAFPDLQFELIGSVCTALPPDDLPNVRRHGVLEEGEKTNVMANWSLALNPVQSGGGSSLKLPDYMAHELVTINTAAGARGFAVVERDAGYVVSLEHFNVALEEALENADRLKQQRANAYRYATEELSWAAITLEYRNLLGDLAASRLPDVPHPGRALLVVTYRYTEPPLGGAEEYLIEVLKQLRTRYSRIDLATVDVGHITNHHHFSYRASNIGTGATTRVGELFDQMQFFTPDPLPEDVLGRSRNLERSWTQREQELFAPFATKLRSPDRLRLFSGFFWPENHGGLIRRWTSPCFSFLLPPRSSVFRLSGFASTEKALRLTMAQVAPSGETRILAEFTRNVSPWFAANFTLPPVEGEDPVLLIFDIDEHQAEGDHRPFGMLLEGASVLISGTDEQLACDRINGLNELAADLADENELQLRTTDFERWVSTLHEMACRNSDVMEADFAAVRGPHSEAMQAWIAAHASNYDTILVQGIPFDVIPSTVETVSTMPRRPRLVTLPHFHGDDRFYYWRRYLNSFAQADKNLFFSSSIAHRLLEHDKAAVVPGGGVRTYEHGDPTAKTRFREVHAKETPFFLVLGRKTASKGYERIVRAHQKLRAQGVEVDLILIGPDEDGQPIEGEGIHYLGRQPREVVRGALTESLGLITMSISESFGIVLCEAWLFGKPVIANQTCYSFRELVRPGENGLLAQSDEDLVAAMAELIQNPEARYRMGLAGFADVQDRFTWPAVADAILDVLT